MRRFLRPPRRLDRHQWQVLAALGTANLVDSYDLGILSLALPQIQRGLAIAEGDVGGLMAAVRLGVMPALALTVLADSVGRRRLLLLTIVCFTACTALTAFVRSPVEFAALQFLARIFIAAEGMLAVVVVVEELEAGNRGWGLGVLGAMGALGHGVASLVFSVVNVLPFGWRALYGLGVVPLLLLAWFRRSLRETRRFEARQARPPSASAWREMLRPLQRVVRAYPGRIVALSLAVFPAAFAISTAAMFSPKFLQETHGYSPAQVATLYLTVGVLAPLGHVAGGRLGDLFGRKRVLVVALCGSVAAIAGFYNLPGVWVPLAWGLTVMTGMMSEVLFAALGSELFPTSYRSTASGVRAVVATLGTAAGLWLEGYLYAVFGSHAMAISAMLLLAPLAPLVVACCLPETANRELEAIAPEKPE